MTLKIGQEVETVDGRTFTVQALPEPGMVKLRHLSDTYSITTSVRNVKGVK